MATPALQELESEFARLSPEAQLGFLERLVHQARVSITSQRDEWESGVAAMAADPEIQKELARIDAEFRVTETDRLGID